MLLSKCAFASHISGGEIFYEYIGPGTAPNTDQYRISMRLFRECNSNGQILNGEVVNIGIFSTNTNKLYKTLLLNKLWVNEPPLIQNTPGAIPCLTGDGSLCYQVGLFDSVIDLPKSANGYTLSWVRCCRQQVTNVFNTPYPDSAQGSTFITHIPGTNVLPNGHSSSPQFVVKDTVLVCAGKPFKLDFSAFDKDNDSLAYTFCEAYLGATPPAPNPLPDSALTLTPLPYLRPYSGAAPLGQTVNINVKTGLISGTAPATPGKYVVNVCVEEYRHGVLINIHHKDFILKISNCDFASAQLHPSYIICDSLGAQFENLSTSAQIHSYFWDFGVPGALGDTSTDARPFFNYPDSGTYKVKLVINKYGQCGDSTTTIAKIYPGFKANFGFTVQCLPDATIFTDSSISRYGKLAGWNWAFGDNTGISTSQSPTHNYTTSGTKNVKLTVTSTIGCKDSITRQVIIPVRLALTQSLKDTTICIFDNARLIVAANVNSLFTWLPNTNISSTDSSTVFVYPASTTTYNVFAVDSSGCKDSASITVNVAPLPILATIPDTTICSGSTITLATNGNGSIYNWQPSTGLNNTSAANPLANPVVTTEYSVIAKSAAGCIAKDSVKVSVNLSPTVTASRDSLICVDGAAHINAVASVNASYSWLPATGLNNSQIPAPTASPTITTAYQVQVTDSNNCHGYDTVLITVIPRPVFTISPASHAICKGDTILLTATGGDIYQWSPAVSIYNDTAAATNATPQSSTTYTVAITNSTCHVSDTLHNRIYVSPPFALSITKSNDVDCIKASAQLQANGGGTSFTWSPAGSLNNPNSNTPVASPIETTTYYVTARNGTACVEKDSIQVKIITADEQNGYYLPSAFTPNGDGKNDCFNARDWGGIKSIQLSVYNRWGQMIFNTTSPSGCWDGTLNGIPQAPGTYVYQVWADTICGKVYRKGTLVLIR